MKIVQLTLDEEALLAGIDAIALVESPAIEEDFYAFSKQKFQSYTDYPESATNAAKRALEWRDNHPEQECGTRVGWARANQLAKREPISEETIARMASFARHLQYEDVPYSEGCGGLMVDAWGARAGIEWAQRKLKEIREEMQRHPSNIDVYGYLTQNFEVCPAAISLFNHMSLEMYPDMETIGMIRANAIILDQLFAIEKQVVANNLASEEDLLRAVVIAADFVDLQHQIDERLGMDHNLDWVKGHLDIISGLLPQEMDADVAGLPQYINELPEDKKNAFAALKDKQMLIGKLMTANKLIPRIDENGDMYYAYFTSETIQRLAYKFQKEGYQNNWNWEHMGDHTIDGVTLVESWIVEDSEHDKGNIYGLDPQKGDWIGMVKIHDKQVWKDYVKSGLVKGFSIEGWFADKLLSQPQEFVKPTPLETQDDFIPRCVSVMMDEGADLEQALGACYGMWNNK